MLVVRRALIEYGARTRSRLLTVVASALFALIVIAAPPAAAQQMSVAIQGKTVTVTGITPGASVAIFGVAREPKMSWSNAFRWSAVVTDTTRSGSVTYTVDRPIPARSLWSAVDLSTRQFVVTANDGSGVEPISSQNARLKRGVSGAVQQFAIEVASFDMLYVSPDGEAWTWSDHGPSVTKFNYDKFATVIDSAQGTPLSPQYQPPPEFQAGGVIVVFDLWKMQGYSSAVTASAIGSAQ